MGLIFVETHLGRFSIVGSDEAVTALSLPGRPVPEDAEQETPVLSEAKQQLLAYLHGQRRVFDLPLNPVGTEFQRKVWKALSSIPYGETRTYGQIAMEIDRPKAVRAVGQANNRNPIPIFIPCHRVVGADGSLTGYAGGLKLKEHLLTLERSTPC